MHLPAAKSKFVHIGTMSHRDFFRIFKLLKRVNFLYDSKRLETFKQNIPPALKPNVLETSILHLFKKPLLQGRGIEASSSFFGRFGSK